MPRKRKKSVPGGGSVYQRKSDGRWVAKFKVVETGKYKELYASTEKEAIAKLQQALYEQKQGIMAPGKEAMVKLKDYLEDWLETVHKPTLRVSSYVKYRGLLHNYIIPELGHIQLKKLTSERVEAFYTKILKEGVSPKGIHAMHGILRKAFDHAVRRKRIAINVCEYISLPRIPEYEGVTLDGEQARKLLEVVKGHRLECLLTVAVATGMRRGELLALRWKDIDFRSGALHIRRSVNRIAGHGFVVNEPKTTKGRRTIVLPSLVLDALNKHRLQQNEVRNRAGTSWQENDLVFCSRNGNFLYPDYEVQCFQRLLEKAGLPHMRFHDLRHSAATILLSMGIHPKVVQELLGHSRIQVTMDIYSHVLPSMSLQEDAMSKLNDLLGGDF